MNKTFSDTSEWITINFSKEKSGDHAENVRIPHKKITVWSKDGRYFHDYLLSIILDSANSMLIGSQAEVEYRALNFEISGLKFASSVDSASTHLLELNGDSSVVEYLACEMYLAKLFDDYGNLHCRTCNGRLESDINTHRLDWGAIRSPAGIVVFSTKISSREEIEYYSAEKLIVDGRLIGAQDLDAIPDGAMVVLASLKIDAATKGQEQSAKMQQIAGELLDAGFKELTVTLFEDRSASSQSHFVYSGRPFCDHCQVEIDPQSAVERILGGISLSTLRQSTVQAVLSWWRSLTVNQKEGGFTRGLEYLQGLGLGSLRMSTRLSEMSSGQLVKLQLAKFLFLDVYDTIVVIRDVLDIFTTIEREELLKSLEYLRQRCMTIIVLGGWSDFQSNPN